MQLICGVAKVEIGAYTCLPKNSGGMSPVDSFVGFHVEGENSDDK